MAREDFGKSKPRRKSFNKDRKPRKDSRKGFNKGSDKGYKKENRGPRKDFDRKPRRDSESKSRRDFDRKPRKDFDKKPRRDFDRKPREDFDKKPARRFSSKPRKEREEINIKKLGINGEGIGYIKKKVIFVQNALPVEMVEVEIDKKTQTYMLGHVTAYKKPSSARKDPECDQYNQCMGCALKHMNYADQLVHKRELLKETLHKYTDLSVKDLDIKPVVGMKEPEHYRHIVAFPITYFSGKLCVGVYQRETKFLTLMDHCPLQTQKINSLLVKIEDILNANNCRDYNDKFKKGLRFLIVRQIGEEMQVAFVTGQDGISQTVTKEIAALDEVTALYYTVNTSRYQDFYEQGFKRIYGQTHAQYKDFKISVRSDMILNPEMDDEKTRQIASLLDKKEEVLSMGCGSGIMELQLENKVVAIDDNKVSIHDATENAKRLELDNKLFVAGHVNDQAAHHLKNHRYDALIINETVDGMTEDLLKSITLSGIKHLIIVSDNMSTLAKTLHQLEEMYDVNTIISLDKEPHTPRLEIIVDLKRK